MRTFILLWLITASSFQARSVEPVPENIPFIPVMLQVPLPNGQSSVGGGVFLGYSNKDFLITVAHNIFNLESTNREELLGQVLVISAAISINGTTNLGNLILPLSRLQSEGCIKRDPTNDVAVVLLGSNHERPDKSHYVLWEHGVVSLALVGDFIFWGAPQMCRLFDDIPDGSEAYVFGYPMELLKTGQAVNDDVDFLSPLIRRGIISQRNKKKHKLIIDTGVYGGNSGGPVMIVQHFENGMSFRIGGIISRFVPVLTRTNYDAGITNSVLVYSGYGVAEPIDFALELMKQF